MGDRDDRRPSHPPTAASGSRSDRRRGGVLPGWLYLAVGVVLLVVAIALWRGNVAAPSDAGTLPVTVTLRTTVQPTAPTVPAASSGPRSATSTASSIAPSTPTPRPDKSPASSRTPSRPADPTPSNGATARAATAGATAGPSGGAQATFVPGAPATLELPSLGVTAAVDPVVSVKGILQVPEDISRLGWWRYSALAGATSGTTVIDGHIDSATAGQGALFNLARVSPGDTVTVTTTAGARLAYRVQARKVYVKSEGLPADLFAQDGPGRLIIISCGGSFDPAERSYRDNIAVFAVLA